MNYRQSSLEKVLTSVTNRKRKQDFSLEEHLTELWSTNQKIDLTAYQYPKLRQDAENCCRNYELLHIGA